MVVTAPTVAAEDFSAQDELMKLAAAKKKAAKDARPDPTLLPETLTCSEGNLQCSAGTEGGQGTVQYAIVTRQCEAEIGAGRGEGKQEEEEAGERLQAFVVFRGTQDPWDWTVNIGLTAVAMPSAEDLVVHGGMLNGLQDATCPALTNLAEKLRLLYKAAYCGRPA